MLQKINKKKAYIIEKFLCLEEIEVWRINTG